MRMRIGLALGVLSIGVLLEDGCLIPVQREEVVVSGPVVEYGWEPVYYDGYVVYYTDEGIPFYYVGGAQVWIPSHERYYYTEHYYGHREAYHTWYQHRGRQYYGYRHPDRVSYHQGRPVMRPHDNERPVMRPHDDGRPVVNPRQTEEHRPVIRPRDDSEHRPAVRPHNDVERKPVSRHRNDNEDDKHKAGPH